jgi:hypothetical protein
VPYNKIHYGVSLNQCPQATGRDETKEENYDQGSESFQFAVLLIAVTHGKTGRNKGRIFIC